MYTDGNYIPLADNAILQVSGATWHADYNYSGVYGDPMVQYYTTDIITSGGGGSIYASLYLYNTLNVYSSAYMYNLTIIGTGSNGWIKMQPQSTYAVPAGGGTSVIYSTPSAQLGLYDGSGRGCVLNLNQITSGIVRSFTFTDADGLILTIPTYSTPGGIPYINSGNTQCNVDASNLYWNYTSKLLSVSTAGDTTGSNSINIYKTLDAYATNAVNTAGDPVNNAGVSASTSRGSGTSPTQSLSGDYIGGFNYWAYNGTTYACMADIRSYVQGGISGSYGGTLQFYTKRDGSTSAMAMQIDNAQKVFVGSSYFSGAGLLNVASVTTQLSTCYNNTNYMIVTTGSTGSTTFDLAGTSPTFTFSKSLAVTGTTATNNTITTVSGSTSGTAKFSQPYIGNGHKKIIIYCAALLGTASYTFPTAFSNTPVVLTTNGLSSSIVTSLTTGAVTITGTTSTGFLIIEGF